MAVSIIKEITKYKKYTFLNLLFLLGLVSGLSLDFNLEADNSEAISTTVLFFCSKAELFCNDIVFVFFSTTDFIDAKSCFTFRD